MDAEAYRIQKEERGGPVSSNEGNVSEFLKIRKRLKEEKKKISNSLLFIILNIWTKNQKQHKKP